MNQSDIPFIDVRPCVKCGATDRNKSGKCKPCCAKAVTAWKKANPEKVKASKDKYRENNLEKGRVYAAKRYAEIPENQRAASKKYTQANPEKVRAKTAKWQTENAVKIRMARQARYEKNAVAISIYHAFWRMENKEALRIIDQNYRARKLNNGGKLSRGLEERLFKLQKGLCSCCRQPLGDNYHLDHITPLALGGANTDDNIQLLRQRCNNQKGAKDPLEFMQSRGFLL